MLISLVGSAVEPGFTATCYSVLAVPSGSIMGHPVPSIITYIKIARNSDTNIALFDVWDSKVIAATATRPTT